MPLLKLAMRWILGLFFIFAGSMHFLKPKFYVQIMPPYLPWHLGLVYVSGVFEIALGVMLLIPRTQPLAAWGLIALLIVVFPANLHMAVNTDLYPSIKPFWLWLRLPLQLLPMAWAYWVRK